VTAALRSLSEALAHGGEPSAVYARLVAELVGRVDSGTAVRAEALRQALVAAGLRSSPRQMEIELRSLGVIGADGRMDQARATAVGLALEIAAPSFESPRASGSWRPVATVPAQHWRDEGIPAVRQTGGTLLAIIDSARRTLRIAVPFVDEAAARWLAESLAQAHTRGVTITISTSPGHADFFATLMTACDDHLGGSVRVVEVDAESSPLGSHAKVVSADGNHAYLGSANLTAAGIGRQFEIGAEVTGAEVGQIDAILEAVDRLGVVRMEVGA